jgi:hypothetical protein
MITETPVITGYIQWLHTLNAHGVHRVASFMRADTRYRTPEGESVGARDIAALFVKLFEDGQKVVIRVNDVAGGQDGHTVYLRWDRMITGVNAQKQTLSGVSEIMLGLDGRIASVIEHWDRVPVSLKKRGYFGKLFGR